MKVYDTVKKEELEVDGTKGLIEIMRNGRQVDLYLKEKRKCLSPHCYSGQFSHVKTNVKLLSTCTNSITRYQVKLPDSVTPGSAPQKLKHSGEQALQIAWAAQKAGPCLRILYHSNRKRSRSASHHQKSNHKKSKTNKSQTPIRERMSLRCPR